MIDLKTTSRWLVCCALAALAACNQPTLQHQGPPKLSVQPARVDFGLVWVGQPQTAAVIVTNEGQLTGSAAITISGPFSVDVTTLEIPGGSHSTLTVRYDPSQGGHDTGTLKVETIAVPLSADARVIPYCAADLCEVATFDTLSRSCTREWKPDGTSCQSSCLSGTCQQGVCMGTFDACSDGDACTADACAEPFGCSHVPIDCPAPSDPCQVAACDPKRGCGTTAAPDGTSCSENLCTSATVGICLQGQCVQRPRLAGTRCGDTWVSAFMPQRGGMGLAFDSDRGRLVLFGGGGPFGDTWEWDGTKWTQRFPASAPSARGYPSMTYDPVRHVTLLFGGDQSLSDTWQWDGTSWTQLNPAHVPPGRNDANLSFDTDRQVAVLFGGVINGYYSEKNDTWEWDGTDWTQRTPAHAPSPRDGHVMAYDPTRKRTVLYGGYNSSSNIPYDTWEWDGTDWTEVSTNTRPQLGGGNSVFYDPLLGSIVYAGGNAQGQVELWQYSGADWSLLSSGGAAIVRYGYSVWDSARQQLVMTGGETDTWVFDGAQWSRSGPAAPPASYGAPLAYDSARQRTVVFPDPGGVTYWGGQTTSQTWEWDGTQWHQMAPLVSPMSRGFAAMAYDARRQVTVMFGGGGWPPVDGGWGQYHDLDETWEYDGTTWVQRTPAHSPPPRTGPAMAYDSIRQRVVLWGGASAFQMEPFDDTWEYDGTDWVQVATPVKPPGRGYAMMAFDAARAQMVLFGGTDQTFNWGVANPAPSSTWLYDGGTWVDAQPAAEPWDQNLGAIAYDPLRQRMMQFNPLWFGWQTWAWDGTQWSQRSPSGSLPIDRTGAIAVYDAARDELVMFGGRSNDVWKYIPP